MSVLDKFISLGFSVSTPDSKIIDCRESIKELMAERDALVAQIRMIRNIFRDEGLSPSETLRKIPFVIDLAEQQCLAEIEAEAGRAGFIAGYHKMHIEFVGSLASGEGAEFAADQYAAKTRQGVDL